MNIKKKLSIEWNEALFLLPLSLVLFAVTPTLFRWIDPTAGAYDIGILQSLVLASIALFFGKTVIWITLKLGAPGVYGKLRNYLLSNHNHISQWQKGLFSLCYFSVLLLAWVLLVMSFI